MEIDEVILNNVGTLIQSLINLLGILAAGILIYNLVSRLDANVQLDKIKNEYKDDVNKFLEILIVHDFRLFTFHDQVKLDKFKNYTSNSINRPSRS